MSSIIPYKIKKLKPFNASKVTMHHVSFWMKQCAPFNSKNSVKAYSCSLGIQRTFLSFFLIMIIELSSHGHTYTQYFLNFLMFFIISFPVMKKILWICLKGMKPFFFLTHFWGILTFCWGENYIILKQINCLADLTSEKNCPYCLLWNLMRRFWYH